MPVTASTWRTRPTGTQNQSRTALSLMPSARAKAPTLPTASMAAISSSVSRSRYRRPNLRRRRHAVGHLGRVLRTPRRAGTDQTESRPGAGQLNRVRELSHAEPETENLGGEGVHRRFGIPGVEFCDNHHTLPPLLLVVSAPMLGPLLRPSLRRSLPGHGALIL